ncbi:MAG TPA: glutamate--tRNA ligase, partial [Syntrophomonadaceae bacterium]|nr:glutamate--tRNA ligase [Syntrophomonadaceae bacterium]
MEDIRVRFAPSPTGSLHIGGARTALFNWLFARHHGGKMVLRLEDTDMKRSTQSSADGIIDGLRWLGLDWDEGPDIGGPYGPYRQSERQQIYQKYIQQLLREDKAYYCFCPEERIEALREKARQKKTDYRYDGHCRQLSLSQAEQRIQAGQKPVVRLKIPCEGDTVVQDLIRGQVHFSNRILDDFIFQKSDGNPTYNFAVVVDDYCMH